MLIHLLPSRCPGSGVRLLAQHPEGVPIPAAAPLVGTAAAATGQNVDGISCQVSEQTLFHIHAHLTIFVNGSARQVPAAIGIPGAQATATAQAPFIETGACFLLAAHPRRVFCNFASGQENFVWTQDDGHLLGWVDGPVHEDVWNWWVGVHHNIGFAGSPMNM
jgi:hypothetical protein